MLVITRREGQRIVIPEAGIEIVVARIFDNGAVRVGVQAPPELTILRKELVSRQEARR